MRNRINSFGKLVTMLVLLLSQAAAFASHELSNSRVSGTNLTASTILNVQDNKICYVSGSTCSPALSFVDASVASRVTLGVDHYATAYNNAYDLTFKVKIIYKSLANPYVFAPLTTQSVITDLHVAYKPQQGTGNYNDKSVYTFNGGYDIIVQVLSVTDNLTNAPATAIPSNLFLEAEIDADRVYSSDLIHVPYVSSGVSNPIQVVYVSSSDEIELNWQHIDGAEEYDLEWTWVSQDVNTAGGFSYEINFRNNSTRVRTANQYYRVSNIFEKGWVFFRVRGVGRIQSGGAGTPVDLYAFTPWTWPDMTSLNTSIFTPGLPGTTGINTPYFYAVSTDHETLKNWQYKATYAEEGKKKEVISYFDGSLRNRQSVTKTNSENLAIVAETYYDFQGRPAVQALPVPEPMANSTIKFYQYSNGSASAFNFDANTSAPFTKKLFDGDATGTGGTCNSPVVPMNNNYGTSKYYSPNSIYLTAYTGSSVYQTMQQGYVPDASLLPYTQTEYVNDNTGRIARQGGVGENYQLGSGHETKYFYGSPASQDELNRLFGSEVGYRKHYKKNMVVDANGQVSITYMDMSGKTIATALAGQNPQNVTALKDASGTALYAANATTVTADLLNKLNPNDPDTPYDDNDVSAAGDALIFKNEILVPESGNYEFHYDVTGTGFTYACNSQNFCYDCVYDLEINIVDKCSQNPTGFTKIRKVVGNIQPSQLNATHDGIVSLNTDCEGDVLFTLTPDPLTVHLDQGNYTVYKTLTINRDALAYYLQQYIDNNTCIKTEQDFINDAQSKVDTSGCHLTCEECVTALGDPANYRPGEYDTLVRICREPCQYISTCETSYLAMLSDVSPGGQYAEWDAGNGVCDPSQYILSVLNGGNALKVNGNISGIGSAANWRNPTTPYVNDDGSLAMIDVVMTPSGLLPPVATGVTIPSGLTVGGSFQVAPQQLADVYDFVQKWNPGWATSLVKYHPEYCYYEWCIKNSDPTFVDPAASGAFTPYTITYDSHTSTIRCSEDFDSLLMIIEDPALLSSADLNKILTPMTYDPYFNGGRGSFQKTNLYTTNQGTGISFYEAAVNRFYNYQKRHASDPGSGLTIYQFAYSIANNFAQLYGSNPTSFPFPTVANPQDLIMATTATQKQTFEKYKFLYLSMKQELQSEASQHFALFDCKNCNTCVGNSNFNPFSIPMALYPLWFGFVFGGGFSPVNWYYVPTQSCGFWGTDAAWYSGKVKRFPSTDDAMGLDLSSSNANVYAQTGKCPNAVDLEVLLNTLAVGNQIETNVNLSTIPQFSQLIYTAVGGNVNTAYQYFTWTPVVTNGGLTLTGSFAGSSSTGCSAVLNWPSTGALSPLPTWNNTIGTGSAWTITQVHHLAYTGTSAGQDNFTIQVDLVNTTSSAVTTVTLTGSTCIPLNGCSFEEPCRPNSSAFAIKNLMSALAANNALCSTTGIDLMQSPYQSYFLNSVGVFLPAGQWMWKKDPASNNFYIYDNTSPSPSPTTIQVSPGSAALCGTGVYAINSVDGNSNIATNSLILTAAQLSGSTISTFTVDIYVGIKTTAGQTYWDPLTLTNCEFNADCATPEHQVKADLEKLLTTTSFQGVWNNTAVKDFTSAGKFTVPLRASLNNSLGMFNTSSNGSNPPTTTVNQVNYLYAMDASASTSTLLVGNFCTSATTSMPASTGTCCSISLQVMDTDPNHTIANITSVSTMTVLSTPLTNGESHDFLITATYANSTTGIIQGHTSCFALRDCVPCSPTPVTSGTTTTNGYVLEDFENSPAYDNQFTINPHCPRSSYYVPNATTLANEQYTQTTALSSGTLTIPAYAGQSYFLRTCDLYNKVIMYQKDVDIHKDQVPSCFDVTFQYLLAAPPSCFFDLYLNNTLVSSKPVTANSPNWNLLDFAISVNTAMYLNSAGNLPIRIELRANNTSNTNVFGAGMDNITLTNTCDVTSFLPCVDDFDPDTMPTIPYENPCVQFALEAAAANGSQAYDNYIDSLKTDFTQKYIAKCLSGAIEHFTMKYPLGEYHYTLYYYDQAGNLIKTVPPQGVVLETNPANLALINAQRLSNSNLVNNINNTAPVPSYNLAHTLTTDYAYNSLNQLKNQNTPDGGTSNFWYDALGRLVASQNAKQYAASTTTAKLYSYTHYDALGRISQVGEMNINNDLLAASPTLLTSYLNNPYYPGNLTVNDLHEVTTTYYGDDAGYAPFIPLSTFAAGTQQYIRSRVAASTIEDLDDNNPATYNHATYYNYDVHGNVNELIQDNPSLAGFTGQQYKKVQYTYDLVSGKVNTVSYQAGQPDQSYHRYEYDADNRITQVYTSHDNVIWDRDAKYFYYLHGPLARVETGDNKVQGTDYAYTLQGWIKGVNSTVLSATNDIGKDAMTSAPSGTGYSTLHKYVASDAAGYSLRYYDGHINGLSITERDYKATNTAFNTPAAAFMGDASVFANSVASPALYNGNISQMSTSFLNIDVTALDPVTNVAIPLNAPRPQLNEYGYDQLNRLITARSDKDFNKTTNAWNNSTDDRYKEMFSYDANGNIMNVTRNGDQTANLLMDDFTYLYKPGTNQLDHVHDAQTNAGLYTGDVDDQAANNYGYDAIGNLIRDDAEGIATIEWTVYGKIKRITYTAAAAKPTIEFAYDAMGNRISKHVFRGRLNTTTYYMRDAQGNVMAVYSLEPNPIDIPTLYLNEQHVYGSSRVGMHRLHTDLIANPTVDPHNASRNLGEKDYELSNHLGNVLAVITDKKWPQSANSLTIDSYLPDITSTIDYYAFHSEMPGRKFNSDVYRYGGSNGQEKDNEIFQGAYTAEYWEYDSRLGRRWNLDPIPQVNQSDYTCFNDNPVYFMDIHGDSPGNGDEKPKEENKNGGSTGDKKNFVNLTGSKNLMIIIKEQDGKLDEAKLKKEAGKFDYIVVNNLQEGEGILKKYYGDKTSIIENVLIRSHGNAGGGLYLTPYEKYDELSDPASPNVKSLKYIGTLLTGTANIMLSGCNIAMSGDLNSRVGEIFLNGTKRNLFANYACTMSFNHPFDTDNSGTISNGEAYSPNLNRFLVKPTSSGQYYGGFKHYFYGEKCKAIITLPNFYNIKINTEKGTFDKQILNIPFKKPL